VLGGDRDGEDNGNWEGKSHRQREALSWRNSACLTFCLLSLAFFASLSFSQPPDPSQIPEPQIAYALHATWNPDLTDNNPSVCTTSDTVAVPSFHFYAGWKDGAPAYFSVDWVLIEELTTDHEPQVWLFGNLQGESGFPYCTMPPALQGFFHPLKSCYFHHPAKCAGFLRPLVRCFGAVSADKDPLSSDRPQARGIFHKWPLTDKRENHSEAFWERLTAIIFWGQSDALQSTNKVMRDDDRHERQSAADWRNELLVVRTAQIDGTCDTSRQTIRQREQIGVSSSLTIQ
jgi:hypothetical protein